MTDLRDPPPEPAAPAARSPAFGDPPDPLRNLYKMSRTAGLGSGEYVAINNTSVVAFLLGLASVLAAVLSPMLLVLPVVAVVCGAVALWQIRDSNGTQTGRAFAGLGILFALLLGGYAVGKIVMARVADRADADRMAQLIDRLGQDVAAGRYEAAYGELFTDRFKQQFDAATFANRWGDLQRFAGTLQSLEWNRRTEFQDVPNSTDRRGVAVAQLKLAGREETTPQPIQFVRQGGAWRIDGVATLFDPPKKGPGPAGVDVDPTVPQGPQFPGPPPQP